MYKLYFTFMYAMEFVSVCKKREMKNGSIKNGNAFYYHEIFKAK